MVKGDQTGREDCLKPEVEEKLNNHLSILKEEKRGAPQRNKEHDVKNDLESGNSINVGRGNPEDLLSRRHRRDD